MFVFLRDFISGKSDPYIILMDIDIIISVLINIQYKISHL